MNGRFKRYIVVFGVFTALLLAADIHKYGVTTGIIVTSVQIFLFICLYPVVLRVVEWADDGGSAGS